MANQSGKEIRLIVVGKTGTGKSSVLNTIAGTKHFKVQPAQEGVTQKCESKEIQCEGKKLFVFDTPGVYDIAKDNKQVIHDIGVCMALTSPGFHVLIFVIKLNRFTREEEDAFQLLVDKLGRGIYSRSIILFTGADAFEHDGGTFELFIENQLTGYLKDRIQDCQNRVIAFNNRATYWPKRAQVQKLMRLIDGILEENGSTFYTDDIYQSIETNHQQEVRRRLAKDTSRSEEQVIHEIRDEIEQQTGYYPEYIRWWHSKNRCPCVIL